MFTYNISKSADNRIFRDICGVIETNVKGVRREKLLMDVDGTLIQRYTTGDGKITVFNDYEVDAVYVDSDLDLTGVI